MAVLRVLVLVFAEARKSVGDGVVDAFLVLDVEAPNLLKGVKPPGLAAREVGLCLDEREGSVVGVDSEVAAVKVVGPGLEGVYDGE